MDSTEAKEFRPGKVHPWTRIKFAFLISSITLIAHNPNYSTPLQYYYHLPNTSQSKSNSSPNGILLYHTFCQTQFHRGITNIKVSTNIIIYFTTIISTNNVLYKIINVIIVK